MIGRSRTQDDPFHPCREEEEEFEDQTKYLGAVGALTYLSTFTRPNISFAMGVLACHNQKPSKRHWFAVKHLLQYLQGTEDLGLYYTKYGLGAITGYADASYKSDVVFSWS